MGLGSASFWVDLGERTVRAFAQGCLVGLGVGTAVLPVQTLPWLFAAEIGGTQAALTVLTGLAALKVGDRLTASFLPSPPGNAAAVKAVFTHKDT